MGVAIPQIITEDRASGALVVDGSLKFDSAKSQGLTRTFTSGNTTTWTYSWWQKKDPSNTGQQMVFAAYDGTNAFDISFAYSAERLLVEQYTGATNDFIKITSRLFRDPSAWYHFVVVYDSSNGTAEDRIRIYVNGIRETSWFSSTNPSSSKAGYINSAMVHGIGRYGSSANYHLSSYLTSPYFIDGQALDASYFGYTDPLTNTWRPKKLSSSIAFGTNGFYLPFDGSAPIGQDQSGRGNNWTPVNFGGSNTLEKATGALPILNTDGGGKVARVGVRTDAFASSLVLALPLVGIKSDFSNAVNSGTNNKAVTNNGVSFSSSYSNFYGGSGYFNKSETDFLTVGSASDWVAFNNGSDFTFETWFYPTSTGGGGGTHHCLFETNGGATTGAVGLVIGIDSNGAVRYFLGKGSSPAINLTTDNGLVSVGVWNHIAVSQQSKIIRIFINGVIRYTYDASSYAFSSSNPAYPLYIGKLTDAYWIADGYIQDYRLYTSAKYTSNFIPASTDPDIVPDSPSGVSYSSNLTQITDGAVAFDGSGDYLELAYNSDYDFTGQFTLEAFVYPSVSTGDHSVFGNFTTNATGYWGLGFDYSTYGVFTTFYYQGNTNVTNTGYVPIPRAWNHYAVTRDASNVIRVFLNGQLLPTTATYSGTLGVTSQNSFIGFRSGLNPLNGLISNVHWVKGTCLYTTNFTPPTGPISSVANTKLLCCKSQTSATAADVAPGSISVAGGAAASNFNPFTVNINTQRGKQSGYATLDPLSGDNAASPTPATFTNGNLTVSYNRQSSGAPWCPATIAIPSSGKWYWEFVQTASSPTPPATTYGICSVQDSKKSINSVIKRAYYLFDGQKISGDTYSSYASGASVGDTIGIAVNMDSGVMGFYKNGIYLGNAFTDLISSGYTWVPFLGMGGQNSGTTDANFGQKPFKFPPPAGFQPLTLANTPRPTIVRPDQYVGISTWTGTGAVRSINTGFKPDFVWIKERGDTGGHVLYDTVRGATKHLASHSTNAEATDTDALTSFNNYGFSLGSGYTVVSVNGSTRTYVGWAWKAGGNSNTFNINDVGYATASAAGLTAGTITPTGASVNTKSGFSIITYTGNGSQNATISHGLGVRPSLHILKNRTTTSNWVVLSQSIDGSLDYAYLNSTAAFGNAAQNAPTSSVFSVWNDTDSNANGNNYVAYCWAEIPGFSKFGSFTGNGSSDGPVIITGFSPRWLLIKRTDASNDWWMWDTARSNTGNPVDEWLSPNRADAEYANDADFDFLSNGFKIRTNSAAVNASGGTYIYACWAETPSFNLYGAMSNAR